MKLSVIGAVLGTTLTLLTACNRADPKVAAAMDLVRNKMRDPESSQFRNVLLSFDGSVCGEVNAKNGMGGYVGYKRFIASKGEVWIRDTQNDDPTGVLETMFTRKWESDCRPPGGT